MKKLYIDNLRRRKLASSLFILALIFILITMPLAAISLQSAHQQVKSDITYYSRGSYDLLVRAPGKMHEFEEELGIVPENYIGFGQGGISIEQWETIKNRPDIDIAAPVASIGYFTGVTSNIGIELPTQSTRYLTQYFTTDGVQQYPLGYQYACLLLESPQTVEGSRYKYEALFNDPSLLNSCRDNVAMFPLPTSYNLLVGVDPEQEEALTGVSFAPIKTSSNSRGWGSLVQSDFLPNARTIPILEIEENGVAIEASITIDLLNISPEDTQKFRERNGLQNVSGPGSLTHFIQKIGTPEYDKLLEELLIIPEEKKIQFTSDLGSYLNGFEQEALIIQKDGTIKIMEADGTFLETHDLNLATQYYTAGPVKYEKFGDRLRIKKIREENGVPIYRPIEERGVSLAGVANNETITSKVEFIANPVGTVKIGERKQQLASSPLGIYQFAPVRFIGDSTDEPIEMKPTITPGSFVSAPAKGVTNIESAAVIKGDKPIDAIRVKVAGIEEYTKEAAETIKRIAKEFEEMGFQVTTVAGASPQKLKVEVEGVGLVEESWTTLGAAGTIVGEWNMTNMVLALFFSLVIITYLLNRMLFWQMIKKHEITLLYQLGWEGKHIVSLFRKEVAILLGFAIIPSIGALSVIQGLLDVQNGVFLWQGVILLIMAVLLLFLAEVNTKKIIQSSKHQLVPGIRRKEKRPGRKSLLQRNLLFFKFHIRAPFLQLMIVSALAAFVYLSLTETVKLTNITILGEYINLQTSRWHFLLIISAYLLALITLIESLSTLMMARKKELGIFRSIGWKRGHIFSLYMKEIALWTGIAVGLGSIISGTGYIILYSYHHEMVWILLVSSIGFYLVILLLGSIIIQRYLSRNLGDTLSMRRNYFKGNAKRYVE